MRTFHGPTNALPFILFSFTSLAQAESLARSSASVRQAELHPSTAIAPTLGHVDPADVLHRANRATVELMASTGAGRYQTQSNGAGVIISPEGYIVTAYHVIRDFDSLRVRTSDGTLLPAELVAAREEVDIALVKITASKPLEAASPAAAKRITAGRKAMVVGNPLGMGQSAIRGKLGTVRMVTWDGNKAPLRAIEADVVPGNSGGGAFDIETGELLGITVAKSSTLDGTGYIVPADQLGKLLRESWPITAWIEAHEIHSTLGATLRPVSLRDGNFAGGLLVTHVDQDSPADRAGWHVGDVLVGLGPYQTKRLDDIIYILDESLASPNDSLSYLLARDSARTVGVVELAHPTLGPALAQQPTRSFDR
jgi:S1-C subfamily serine protease